jgi:uncharacterized protein (TIGR00255 family)
MIQSMTGFGSSRSETPLVILNIQIKSVNGRFLETRFRLPREYAPFESELKKLLSQNVARGSFDISVHREVTASALGAEVRANVGLARSWLRAAETLSRELSLGYSNIGLETIMRFPDVVTQPSSLESVLDAEKADLINVFKTALEALKEERLREGSEQYKTFHELLELISTFVQNIETNIEKITEALRAKLLDRLKSLVPAGEVNIDPARLSQEVLFLVEKADVTEEVERAKAHVTAFKKALDGKGAVGKKLEFYTQEIHRELNTIGSKVQNIELTMGVVEAKAVVERLREQVQNVE